MYGRLTRDLYAQDASYNQSLILLFCVGLIFVFLMVGGIGLLYLGLARRKNALSMIFIVFCSLFVGCIQWYIWGYSLAFSDTASNGFIGDLHYAGFRNLLLTAPEEYPQIAFLLFQMQFLLVTLAILAGALIGERGRFGPALIWLFCFATVIYCPVTYWVWGGGWAQKWGVLDYAGGGPVELTTGVAAFCFSWVLGRRNEQLLANFRPHQVSQYWVGTFLLSIGWLVFNGFSAGNVLIKVPYAIMNSYLCGSFGAITWVLLDYRIEQKWLMVAACSGFISGLVAATPLSGVIPLWALVVLGVVAGAVCNFSTKVKYLLGVDEALDVFAEHGVAGAVGLIFNALFGDADIIGLDNVTVHAGGWLNHNWKQLYIQIAYIAAVSGYTAVVTLLLAFAINKIPGLQLRIDYDGEEAGIDEAQIGEFAYDYIEVRRDFLAWGPTAGEYPYSEDHSMHADIPSVDDTGEIKPYESQVHHVAIDSSNALTAPVDPEDLVVRGHNGATGGHDHEKHD